ncbi:hypothetical protein AAE478_002841 [Parahypoxylon ruwenzoriense]
MAPIQNTFSIIPNAPSAINGNRDDVPESRPARRPMTTKQAKKAYQKVNKGPKLSKAEQRRQELFEQDRIRKEFEKEKNQARARAARDKKKEKEEKERAEKKKKGLPLVDVHPSQDTIAWFVRGTTRKHGGQGVAPFAAARDDSDSCTLSAEDEPQPPAKRQKTDVSIQEETNDLAPPAQHLDAREAPSEINDSVEGRSTPKQSDFDADDPATIEILHDELFNEFPSATSSLAKCTEAVRDSEPPPVKDQHVLDDPSSLNLPESRIHSSITTEKPLEEQTPGEIPEDSVLLPPVRPPLQSLSPNDSNSRCSNNVPKEPTRGQRKPLVPIQDDIDESPAQQPRKPQQLTSAIRSFRHPKTPMGPPPLPPKFKPRSRGLVSESRTPPFLLKQTHAPKSRSVTDHNPKPAQSPAPVQEAREENPPTSTQLFMFNHLDDFFPSPSQEVRELFGEPKLNTGTAGNKPKPRITHTTRPPKKENTSTKLISTVSNPIRQIPVVKNRKANSGSIRESIPPGLPDNSPLLPAAKPANYQSTGSSETFDIPFFSTQDFVLSSQDMRDLEDDTLSSSGVKEGVPGSQPNTTPNGGSSSSQKTISSGFNTNNTNPTPRVPSLAPKQAKQLGSGSRERLVGVHSRSSRSPTSNESIRRPKKPNFSRKTPAPAIVMAESSCLRNGSPEIRATFTGKLEYTTSRLTSQQNGGPRASRANESVTPLRASPKPFLASSGREAQYKYAIERNKTTAWESASARRKARVDLEHFQRSEDERLDKLLLGKTTKDGNAHAIRACSPYSNSTPGISTSQQHSQPKSQLRPRPANQLPSSAMRSEKNPKVDVLSKECRQRGRSRSSYEQLIELLENKENKEQGREREQEQQIIAASQETDYGDAGLDDVLYEML